MESFEYIKMNTCEDDYVERGGVCNELTVMITLREYRGLIKEKVKQAAEIERLTAERDNFEKQAQKYGKMLIAKHPDIIEKLTAAVSEFTGCGSEDYAQDDESAADACPLTGCGAEEVDA